MIFGWRMAAASSTDAHGAIGIVPTGSRQTEEQRGNQYKHTDTFYTALAYSTCKWQAFVPYRALLLNREDIS